MRPVSIFHSLLEHPPRRAPSFQLSTVNLQPLYPLSLLECADPQNAPITPLECAVPKTQHLKSFRMRSSEKSGGGVRPLSLTRNTKKDLNPEGARRGGPSRALFFPCFLTSLPHYFLPPSAFNSIHRDSAKQLGIEIGRLLRHHFAGRRDLHHLLDVAGIQQKRNLRASTVNGIECRQGFPFIRQVRFRRHRLRCDSQCRLQDSFVQQHHVQFALQRRNIGQELRQVDARAQRQHVKRPLLPARGGINADGPFLSRAREFRKKFLFRLGPLPAAREREFLRREPRLQMPAHAAPGKIVNVRRHTVPRQNRQPLAPRVDERHHHALVRRVRIDFPGARAALVPVVQRRLIAVMPVRDHQLLVFHRFLDRRNSQRLRNHPQPVHHAELVAHLRGRRRSGFGLCKNRVHAFLCVRIQHEKLPRVRFRMPQKFKPVRLRPGEGLLVPENHSRRIFFKLARANKSAPRAPFFRPGRRVFLRVCIERRRRILHHHLNANPILNRSCGPRVNIVLWRVAGIRAAFLHGNQVVRVRRVIFFLHRRRNLVVRLRQHAVERRARRVVAKSAKRINLGHEVSGTVLCRSLNPLFYSNKPQFRKSSKVNFPLQFEAKWMTVENARPYYNSSFMTAPNFSSVRALIFDLDGTLIDSKLDLIHSVNAMLQEMGREQLREDTISGYIGHGAPQLVAQALGNNATEPERERALKFFLAYYENHKMDSTCAYPGVPEALEHLAAFPMAILTNKPVRISVRILEELGLAKYFRAVYGGNSFETKKPD